MTREEAVQKLITHKLWHQDEFIDFTGTVEAIDMAIEALQEQKTGKWIKISPANIYECSECGNNVMTNDIDCYKYCHGCGARMVEE